MLKRIAIGLLLLACGPSWGAIALEGCNTGNSTAAAGTLTVLASGLPTISDGELLTFHMMASDDSNAPLDPVVATVEILSEESTGADHSVAVHYRVASSESGDYVINWTVGTGQVSVVICVWSGVHADVLDVAYSAVSHYLEITDDETPTPQPITTATNNAVVVISAYNIDGTTITDYTESTGYSLAGEVYAGGRSQIVQYKTVAVAGTETPDALSAVTSNAADDYVVTTIALKADVSASTVVNPITGKGGGAAQPIG